MNQITPQHKVTMMVDSWILLFDTREANHEKEDCHNLRERIFAIEMVAVVCGWEALADKLEKWRDAHS